MEQIRDARSVCARRKVDADARRQAILDAALTVFAERGYEAARLDDVAAKAGVAKGTLYLYFKDKEALFEALVRGAVSPILDGSARLRAIPTSRPLTFSTSLPCSRRKCWAPSASCCCA